ncbi:MAG: hypothetical protein HC929_12645 [Leptolyngbyaceae cyanobacterium SM2_5_2]|nr:hypothetical protein [Leptolyngbyaceae cyanobacterium SM2_5_2]
MADDSALNQVTVTFTDGTVQTFQLPESQGDEVQMASRIRHLMESNFLALETDQKLLLLPMYNIRAIEVSPAPSKLPDTVLKHAVITE